MAKKRKHLKKKYRQTFRKTPKFREKRHSISSLQKLVFTALFKADEPLSINQLFTIISEATSLTKKDVEQALVDLMRRGEITPSGKKRFALGIKGKIFSGRLEKHPRGFGFVVDIRPEKAAQHIQKDPFLTSRKAEAANHGDLLLIRITNIRKDHRPEAEIISILERNRDNIVGYFHLSPEPHVLPEDPRYPFSIKLNSPPAEKLEEGTVVITRILPELKQPLSPSGEIVEILGSPRNIDVQMRIVIEHHALPHIFSSEIEKETESMSISESDMEGRLDLRSILHVTIDGKSAKDFDDAVAVEKIQKGYRLFVSIADVSHFVQENTELDKEAYLRGTSVYFPGKVIPMLPEKLSNDLCSLLPHQDRLTFSAILEFDYSGKLISKKFTKSVIHSYQRFTYDTVKRILVDDEPEAKKRHFQLLQSLEWARELAEILLKKRMSRGSIGFNIPEPEVFLDTTGSIKSIIRKERNFAHQIIEEFMLAANEAVAQLFSQHQLPFIYRIHEKPSMEKVNEFTEFAHNLGLELPPPGNDPEPQWFGKVLSITEGSPAEYVVNNLLLRTMQQARYSSGNIGHFGLAATDYTHFTSPIRRYPDLLVHRFLNQFLSTSEKKKASPKDDTLNSQAEHVSTRERVAVNAERDMNDRLKLFFMEKHIGEKFHAVISGLHESALFIELTELFVSGSIDLSHLKDDYYLFDSRRHRFVGEITGKSYQLGNELAVRLYNVDHHRKRLNFIPADQQ